MSLFRMTSQLDKVISVSQVFRNAVEVFKSLFFYFIFFIKNILFKRIFNDIFHIKRVLKHFWIY